MTRAPTPPRGLTWEDPLPPDCDESDSWLTRIGAGGFGSVHLVVHRKLGRPAAIELLLDRLVPWLASLRDTIVPGREILLHDCTRLATRSCAPRDVQRQAFQKAIAVAKGFPDAQVPVPQWCHQPKFPALRSSPASRTVDIAMAR